MGSKPLDFDDVRKLGLKLPGVVEHTNRMGTSLKAKGKLLACPALNKTAEPNSLMLRIDFDKREELLFTQPDIYYMTPHYVGYPCVVVRLSKIDRKSLQHLLQLALAFINDTHK